ncbi:MAG: PAS domain S-box protein [Fidelibacterota bacterium]|nr:MAG: PAS domain S-box protein [Candidatus Neomarinimicrobiota bacterium]
MKTGLACVNLQVSICAPNVPGAYFSGSLAAKRDFPMSDQAATKPHLAPSPVPTKKQAKVISDGIALLDGSTIIAANEAFADMFGYQDAEVIGLELGDLVTPESRELLNQMLLEEDDTPLPVTGLRKDGSEFPGHLHAVMTALSGKSERVIAIRYITGFIDLEKERDATIELLRLIHTSSDLHELMAETTSMLRRWSDCEAVGIRLRHGYDYPYFETRGFPEEHILLEDNLCAVDAQGEPILDSDGNPLLECMCGNVICGRYDPNKSFFTESGSFWTNCTTDLLATTTDKDRMVRTRNRCNGEGYESVALIPLRVGDQPFGLLQFNDKRKGRFTPELIDQLQRLGNSLAMALAQREAVMALQESEEKYRSLVESAKETILTTDPKGRVASWNSGGQAMLGYAAEDVLGKSLAVLFPDNAWSEEFQLIQMMDQAGQVKSHESVALSREGMRIPVELSISTIRNERGGVAGYSAIIRDITERKQAHEQVARAAKLSALGHMAGGIAHEISSPISTILLHTQFLLKEKDLDDSLRQDLERIEGAATRTREIVNHVLAFARKAPAKPQPCDVEHLLESCLRQFSNEIDQAQVTIERNIETALPILLLDDVQIQQVVLNLLRNAAQAMPEGGVLTISARAHPEEDAVLIQVTDTGVGIPPEHRKNIFDPFFTTKEIGEGTGLGLSLSYGLVEAHGGTIEVESEVGAGSTFTITLPLTLAVEHSA